MSVAQQLNIDPAGLQTLCDNLYFSSLDACTKFTLIGDKASQLTIAAIKPFIGLLCSLPPLHLYKLPLMHGRLSTAIPGASTEHSASIPHLNIQTSEIHHINNRIIQYTSTVETDKHQANMTVAVWSTKRLIRRHSLMVKFHAPGAHQIYLIF